MSIRLTIDCGRTFRSNEETPPRVPAGPARRPFKRTSVRFAPRPRRLIVCAPGPPSVTKLDEIAEVIWVEPAAIGEDCSISAVSSLPSRFDSSGSISETGSGLVNSGWRIREPVTTIVEDLSSGSTWAAGAGGAGWVDSGAVASGWVVSAGWLGSVVWANAGVPAINAAIETPSIKLGRNTLLSLRNPMTVPLIGRANLSSALAPS